MSLAMITLSWLCFCVLAGLAAGSSYRMFMFGLGITYAG